MLNARTIVLSLAFGLPEGEVRAGLTPIGPFSGQLSETWESVPPTPKGEHLPDPISIMGGDAATSNQQMLVFEPSTGAGFGLGSSGQALPSDGLRAMGIELPAQTASVEFANPVLRFGSYWGAITLESDPNIGSPAMITVQFFDPFGAPIGVDTFSYIRPADGILEWHGWTSTIPIKRLTYTEDRVVVDGLQADPVPEPATAVLLGLTAVPFVLRRRLIR